MALDICNKEDLFRDYGRRLRTGAAVPELPGSPPLEGLEPHQREQVKLSFAQTASQVDPRFVAGDPAAWSSDFGYALDRVAVRLDLRSHDELVEAALNHPDAVMREQALYEYVDRGEADAIELLCQAVAREKDRSVRWHALWAVEKLGGAAGMQALRKFLGDADPEVAEWSQLFLSELETGDPAFDGRDCHYTKGQTFDETISLLIHCDLYVRLDPDNQVWGKLSLAPQALGRVYGEAHACPNVETRERQLVIAKTISGLHQDGSPHIDNYLFRGFTERTRGDRGNFYFESSVDRPFFVSGRADDASQGVQQARIGFMRSGCWHLEPRFKIGDADAIRYVRGRFQGWGYFDLDRMTNKPLDQVLTPGNAILSTLHDDVAGPLTNVFISGTFKGKLNDWDGDGRIDLNSRPVYSTVEGELDTDMDGIPDEPGVSCCNYRSGLI